MVGVYGVISYMVSRRRNEIGVRMALGASRRDIVSMVLKEAGTLLVIGLAAGSALAVVGSFAAQTLLFGFTPGDPRAIAFAIVALGTVVALASAIPARRAASIDPAQALRD
jgi:ABC-type antimicrobial peptide transport system permease subunit